MCVCACVRACVHGWVCVCVLVCLYMRDREAKIEFTPAICSCVNLVSLLKINRFISLFTYVTS